MWMLCLCMKCKIFKIKQRQSTQSHTNRLVTCKEPDGYVMLAIYFIILQFFHFFIFIFHFIFFLCWAIKFSHFKFFILKRSTNFDLTFASSAKSNWMPKAPVNHSKTYKVPRRPFESARLDAELKVRLLLVLGVVNLLTSSFSSLVNTVFVTREKSGVLHSLSLRSVELLVNSSSLMRRIQNVYSKVMHSFVVLLELVF